jgi:hypothetical protein
MRFFGSRKNTNPPIHVEEPVYCVHGGSHNWKVGEPTSGGTGFLSSWRSGDSHCEACRAICTHRDTYQQDGSFEAYGTVFKTEAWVCRRCGQATDYREY